MPMTPNGAPQRWMSPGSMWTGALVPKQGCGCSRRTHVRPWLECPSRQFHSPYGASPGTRSGRRGWQTEAPAPQLLHQDFAKGGLACSYKKSYTLNEIRMGRGEEPEESRKARPELRGCRTGVFRALRHVRRSPFRIRG